MMFPKLVCYDKNSWKTLQQLANWTREWSELFTNCFYLRKLTVNFHCTFADDQFIRSFLEGIARIPNI